MTTQINIRLSDELFKKAKSYAKTNGFLNIQEFFREAAREKIYDETEINAKYLQRLRSKDANTFLSEKEAREFEKELARKSENMQI